MNLKKILELEAPFKIMLKLLIILSLIIPVTSFAQWNFFQQNLNKSCLNVRNSCQEHLIAGCVLSGNYKIMINSVPTTVRCEQQLAGGGWIVVQQRDQNTDFYKGWSSYKNGFSNNSTNLWLGLENFHQLTKTTSKKMAIYIEKGDGQKGIAYYSSVQISNEATKYTLLSAGTYSYETSVGYINPIDSISLVTIGRKFTTQDSDNDEAPDNCAVICQGAWWYAACYSSNLNGRYYYDVVSRPTGAYTRSGSCPEANEWRTGFPDISLKKTIMMIK